MTGSWRQTAPAALGVCFFALFSLVPAGDVSARGKIPAERSYTVERSAVVAGPLEGPERTGIWNVWRDGRNGTIRRAAPAGPVLPLLKTGDRAAAALSMLRTHGAGLGIEPFVDQLEPVLVRRGLASEHILFRRAIDGIPVEPGRVGLHTDRHGALLSIDRTTAGALPAEKSGFALARTDGIVSAVGEKTVRNEARAERIYYEDEGLVRPAWRVRFQTDDPPGDWEAVVDGMSGELIYRRDLAMYATGSGTVWVPNPVSVLEDQTLADMNDADQAVFDAAYRTVSLLDLEDTAPGGLYELSGPYVRIGEFENPNVPPPTRTDPNDFHVTRADDDFEAVMAYYHIDTVQRYMRSIGYDGVNADSIVVSPIEVDVHAFNGADNSRFEWWPDIRLFFGDGGVDDAEDGDVIVHEYGHAIEHSQAPDWMEGYSLGLGDMGAMAEGFSDYWAESFAARNGITFDLGQVFDWDLGPVDNFWSGRRVDNGAYAPDSLGDDIYINSLIWSGALWDLHRAVGGGYSDSLILESHFFLNGTAPSSTFENGAWAILQADIAFTGGAHGNTIFQVFENRGIVVSDLTEPVIADAAHPDTLFGGSPLLCSLRVEGNTPVRTARVIYGTELPAGDTLALDSTSALLWTGSVAVPPGADSIVYYYEIVDVLARIVREPAGYFLSRIHTDMEPPVIAHTPRPDHLDSALPVAIDVSITDNGSIDPDSVTVSWSFSGAGGEADSGLFHLTAVGGPGFTGEFPEGPGRIGSFLYSIRAVDASPTRNSAVDPVTGEHGFSVIADSAAPVIVHTPLTDREEGATLPGLSATITDDGRLDPDSIVAEILFSGSGGEGPVGTVSMTNGGGDLYTAPLPELPEPVGTVLYRIVAVDAALAANRTASPAADYHSFEIYPSSIRLVPNGPNPFRDRTEYTLFLSGEREVRFFIYDIAGRLVREIQDGPLGRGVHRLVWDGRNSDGRVVAQGIYIYRLETDGFEKNGRTVHLR